MPAMMPGDVAAARGSKMSTSEQVRNPAGSLWHRWDPHLHTPGTALNDQYSGPDPWDAFLTKVEAADPPIRALGITDYCGIDTYLTTLEYQRKGRLLGVGLIFPNVELRLSIETSKASAINLHLLFSPHDPEHPVQICRFLAGLEFRHNGQPYRCSGDDLMRLGRAHKGEPLSDEAARVHGTNQFKVNFDQLQDRWNAESWVRENCLVAVAGGSKDGTSGLRDDDGSFAALRKNIERFAHIIFSASPQQIAFFRGNGAATLEDLERKWGGRKPCLHGSDAHDEEKVGEPELARRCWLKGDLTFETLRQAVIEPETRVHIGESPPRGALPGNCIQSIAVANAPWMKPSTVPLNPGMTAIIGARGSGKTALADLIASGGYGALQRLSDSSFLRRAAEHLDSATVTLAWEAGGNTASAVSAINVEDILDAPHVQYLSQQFVERMCAAERLDDSLLEEIQRVVFNAHQEVDRLGANDFAELLASRLTPVRQERVRNEKALEKLSNDIATEQIRKSGLRTLIRDRDDKIKAINTDKNDRNLLIAKGQEVRAKRFEVVAAAVEEKQRAVTSEKIKLQALRGLQADVRDFQERLTPEWLDGLKETRSAAALSEAEWLFFGVTFVDDVESLLKNHIDRAQAEINTLEGPAITDPPVVDAPEPNVALIGDGANLSLQTLSLLQRELKRLQTLVGVDEKNGRRFKALSEKITKEENSVARIVAEIERATKADVAIAELRVRREEAYTAAFRAVVDEASELEALYAPLKSRISGGYGSLAKLAFSVRRLVDIDDWARRGEDLLDLRTAGPFRGAGELQRVAEEVLGKAWRQGSASVVSKAMASFTQQYSEALREHRPAQTDFRDWARDIARWLYSTEHISVGYGIQYDGVSIEQLSPGTRGIVLLLLYLALDSDDDRPLIIDQPEENLDPQSVFDELVRHFQEAKLRRQIIIVTHNANLVVNTDVDQVIVARCGPHRPGQLPEISYESGGLEDDRIRAAVCAILEGGEKAFRERARRLRLTL